MEKMQVQAYVCQGVTLLLLKKSLPEFSEEEGFFENHYEELFLAVKKSVETSLFPKLCRKYDEDENPKKRFTARPAVLFFSVRSAEDKTFSIRLSYKTGGREREIFSGTDKWDLSLGCLLKNRERKRTFAFPFSKIKFRFPPKRRR